MRSALRLLVGLILVGWLSACSSTMQVEDATQVPIADGVMLQLSAAPQALWQTSKTQLLEAQYQQESHQLVVQTEFSADAINMVAMTPSGLPVLEISYQANQFLQAKKFITVENLQPSFIIADLQLALWPLAQLKQNLSGDGVEVLDNAQQGRKLNVNGNPVVTIEYQDNQIVIHHLRRDYQLIIRELD